MIWTPMPLELVLEDRTAQRRTSKHLLPDGSVVLADLSDGDERVLRLDATDPQLYLLPEFAPGGPVSTRSSSRRTPERPPDGA